MMDAETFDKHIAASVEHTTRKVRREMECKKLHVPPCDICLRDQTELGAIEYDPPDSDSLCKKRHICVKCYRTRFLGPQK